MKLQEKINQSNTVLFGNGKVYSCQFLWGTCMVQNLTPWTVLIPKAITDGNAAGETGGMRDVFKHKESCEKQLTLLQPEDDFYVESYGDWYFLFTRKKKRRKIQWGMLPHHAICVLFQIKRSVNSSKENEISQKFPSLRLSEDISSEQRYHRMYMKNVRYSEHRKS